MRFLGSLVLPLTLVAQELDENFADVIRKLGEGTVVKRWQCFVVSGTLDAKSTNRILTKIIAPSCHALWKQFFKKKPHKKILILLFPDEKTYRRYVFKLFGEKPSTRFGYYKPDRRTLVVNMGTGGGTLVHELVHCLISPDFPDVPVWLNEGLGCLFEACRVHPNTLEGILNWRLPQLQKAIKGQKIIPLEKLFNASASSFSSLHYAEARYLLLYLQEKGLLERFYQQFKSTRRARATLEKLFNKQLTEIQREWIEWAERLPPSR